MQTTPTADISAAVKKTLTSRAFERFIGLAIDNALTEIQTRPDAVVLTSQPMGRVEFGHTGVFTYYICASRDYNVQVHMQAARMTDDPTMRNVWYGNETRTAEDGTKWTRQIGHMVQDDFGFLVELSA